MGRFGYFDNPERRVTFQDILRDYDPAGYRVRVTYPLSFTGTIIEQMGLGKAVPGSFFKVHLDDPVEWGVYKTAVLRGDEQKSLTVHRQLQQFGCLEDQSSGRSKDPYRQMITCLFVQWQHMIAIDIKKGQPLEYQEGSGQTGLMGQRTTLGIAQSVEKAKSGHIIVNFFLLEPLTWVRAPMAIETDFMRPEYVSKYVTALTTDGVYRDWKEKSPGTLPKGTFSEDKEEYVLHDPVLLEEVRPIADTLTGEDKVRCMLEASLFHVVPIDTAHHSGVFRPMRMEHAGYIIPYIVTKRDVERQAEGQED